MKKFWKIFLISLGSLLLLLCIVISIALWFVFTPARLTPIVSKQAARFVTCHTEIDRVELTFFSSFPRLGLRVDGLRAVNPVAGSPCDTLLRLDRLNAAIDVRAFLKRDELILSDIVLRNGTVCLFADSLGRTNYDILNLGEPAADTTGGLTISRIDADKVTLKNIDVRYVDRASLMDAGVKGLSATLKASVKDEVIGADARLEPFDVVFSMGSADSLMTAAVKGLSLSVNGSLAGGKGSADIALGTSAVTFAYGGEQYLTDGAVSVNAKADVDLEGQAATIHDGALKLNGLELALDGSVRNDTLRGLDMDLKYKFASWPLESVLALVPASFLSYLEGISVEGNISSEGTAVGVYGKESTPMIDLNFVLDEGRVAYPAMLPYPLTGVFADLDLHTDFTDDAVSYAKVNSLRARTPRSSVRAQGTVRRIFSDPHADLTADISGDLADVRPFIPKDMKLAVAGKASGRLKADVRMSQIEKMELDKMKVSGALLLTGLDAVYDTIAVAAPSLKLDFALPNGKPATKNTSFAAASIVADRLDASMSDSTRVSLDAMRLSLETSDILDTLAIPAVVCDFSFGGIRGRMDGMALAVSNPSGKLSLEPGRRSSATQRIKALLNSGRIEAGMEDMSAVVQKLGIDALVVYDQSKEDIWQQLLLHGSIAAEGAVANIAALNYPVEVPSLSVDFNPRAVKVNEARIKLNESDFSLDGTVDNIVSYFRGDSILRAAFNFASPVTNITQLLALTSGIGDEKLEEEKKAHDAPADEFTGPYMVPKGIDISLHADIKRALWYSGSKPEPAEFRNIRGQVRVLDGIMVLSPELTFESLATNGEVEVMYRTPSKNNLFAGVNLHLNHIEVQELLSLIPDLDSLMPMLRSFNGKGEFHASVEGYMDSVYNFKMSTLRGAGSLTATELTLKDDEIFRKIAFLLKYKDEGLIRVDSLRAEFTVFRDEIDLYPFLLSIDRYKAVISGRHNLDMSFDYNISLVQTPLPFRVAVDVKGTPDDLKFKLFSKSRYPQFYRPAYRGEVENRQMQLRNMIRDAITKSKAPLGQPAPPGQQSQ